jgi:hypothetical protein
MQLYDSRCHKYAYIVHKTLLKSLQKRLPNCIFNFKILGNNYFHPNWNLKQPALPKTWAESASHTSHGLLFVTEVSGAASNSVYYGYPELWILRYPAHRYHAVPSPGFEPTTLCKEWMPFHVVTKSRWGNGRDRASARKRSRSHP